MSHVKVVYSDARAWTFACLGACVQFLVFAFALCLCVSIPTVSFSLILYFVYKCVCV